MKRLVVFTLALLLVFGLAACGKNQEDVPASQNKETEHSAPLEETNPTVLETETVPVTQVPTTEAPIMDAVSTGLDISLKQENNGYLAAGIVFSPDMTFEMTVNLLAGYGSITGEYTLSDNGSIVCTVKSKDFSGFVGDTLQSFTLSPQDDGSYVLSMDEVDYLGELHDHTVFSQ